MHMKQPKYDVKTPNYPNYSFQVKGWKKQKLPEKMHNREFSVIWRKIPSIYDKKNSRNLKFDIFLKTVSR